MIQTKISWARLSITLQTRTMPFVGRHRLSKAARLSSEGFLVLAFAADLSTNHNGSKVFLKSKSNLRYFLYFILWQNRKVHSRSKCLVWVKKCCHIWLDQNFDPSLLTNKLWLVFMRKKQNKHERDFVLQVRCRDLNNSCDKISTLRGTKAVTNIILGFFGGNIWELLLIVYIFGNSYEILWILWELSVIVYILKFSWLFAFPNQLIVII